MEAAWMFLAVTCYIVGGIFGLASFANIIECMVGWAMDNDSKMKKSGKRAIVLCCIAGPLIGLGVAAHTAL